MNLATLETAQIGDYVPLEVFDPLELLDLSLKHANPLVYRDSGGRVRIVWLRRVRIIQPSGDLVWVWKRVA